MESRNEEDILCNLPEETLEGIANDPATIIKLSKSSGNYHAFFTRRGELPLASGFLRELLTNAALGEWEAAESVWKLFPDLLTSRGTVHFPNRTYVEGQAAVDIPFDKNPGRYKYINRTAWQIAVMNEEYEEAERMGKRMTEDEKQEQFNEIFPDGKIEKPGFDLEKTKGLLQAVFDEIKKDKDIDGYDLTKMSESTRQALHALRSCAKPKTEHETGLVFDARFYLEALKLYDKDNNLFPWWHHDKFWCVCVEEWLAGCLGTGYLRPHAHGIGNPESRAGCVLSADDNSSYFGFRRPGPGAALPGQHFFVGYMGDARRCPGYAAPGKAGAGTWGFQNLCQAKTRAGTDFMQQFVQAETSVRLIC